MFLVYVSSVLHHRFNDFGVDGGPAAKALRPKFDTFVNRVHSQVGFQLPEIDVSVSLSHSFPPSLPMCVCVRASVS